MLHKKKLKLCVSHIHIQYIRHHEFLRLNFKLKYTITQKYVHADKWQGISTEAEPPITVRESNYNPISHANHSNRSCYANLQLS